MNDERDPLLETLFVQAERDLTDDQFTAHVMAGIRKRRFNVLAGRLTVVALLIALELLLNAPLQNSVGLFTQAMSEGLFQVNNEWLAYAVGPLNSIAGLLAMVLIGLNFLFRKVLR